MSQQTSPRAQAAIGSAIQTGTRTVSLLLGMVLMGYLARRLGAAEYGRYAVAVVLMNWLSISIAVSTGAATVRLVAGQKHGRRYAVSMLQIVGVLATSIAVVIALLAEPLAELLRSPAIAPLLRILSADFAIGTIAGLYAGGVSGSNYGLSPWSNLCGFWTDPCHSFVGRHSGFEGSFRKQKRHSGGSI